MSIDPPSGPDAPGTSDSRTPPTPTGPEARRLRRLSSPISGDAAPRTAPTWSPIPIDRDVLAVERWAIAVRRMDAEVIGEAERADLLSRPDIVAALRAVPVKAPSRWVRWLRRVAESIGRGRGDSPPQPRPR